jgi:hypothetical protein
VDQLLSRRHNEVLDFAQVSNGQKVDLRYAVRFVWVFPSRAVKRFIEAILALHAAPVDFHVGRVLVLIEVDDFIHLIESLTLRDKGQHPFAADELGPRDLIERVALSQPLDQTQAILQP